MLMNILTTWISWWQDMQWGWRAIVKANRGKHLSLIPTILTLPVEERNRKLRSTGSSYAATTGVKSRRQTLTTSGEGGEVQGKLQYHFSNFNLFIKLRIMFKTPIHFSYLWPICLLKIRSNVRLNIKNIKRVVNNALCDDTRLLYRISQQTYPQGGEIFYFT